MGLGVSSWRLCHKEGCVNLPHPQNWSSLQKRCAMCWNEWKIVSQIFPIFSFWSIVAKEVTKDAQKKIFKSFQICWKDPNCSDNYCTVVSQLQICNPPPPLRSGHLDIKDEQCAKKNDGPKIWACVDAAAIKMGVFGAQKSNFLQKWPSL